MIEKELPIRRALDLPSGLFVVRISRGAKGIEAVTFTGAGHGHGVGLCQAGAHTMAAQGFSYTAILNHYYSGASVVREY